MGKTTGSWLSGATAAVGDGNEYRGQDLGLPESGPGSLATTGRRVLGFFLDWVPCGLIALAIVGTSNSQSTLTAGIWLAVGVLTVTLFGFTPGQYFAGIAVARVEGGGVRVGFVRALARAVLILFIVPPLLQDNNGRGLHDRATGTMLVRTR